MDRPDMESAGRWLRDVEVRPVRGVEERRRWDALMARHHYLPFHGLFGKSLRHVAVRGETWLALLGWQAGAFKVGVRDAWIGWSREQQFSRLHLIANNSRFAVLEEGRVPNLASRALGLSLRRLARDMRDAHGHPALLAETFVDPSRFAGTCYRASNWRSLGRTRGYSREPGGIGARAGERSAEGGAGVRDGEGRADGAVLRGAARGLAGRCRGGTAEPARVAQPACVSPGHAGLPQGPRAALRPGLLRDDHDRGAAGGLSGRHRLRRVRRAAEPGPAAGGGGVLQPEPRAPHRAGAVHVPLRAVGLPARHAGPDAERVGAPAQRRRRAGGHGRQGRARRVQADRRRAPHDGRRSRARLPGWCRGRSRWATRPTRSRRCAN